MNKGWPIGLICLGLMLFFAWDVTTRTMSHTGKGVLNLGLSAIDVLIDEQRKSNRETEDWLK